MVGEGAGIPGIIPKTGEASLSFPCLHKLGRVSADGTRTGGVVFIDGDLSLTTLEMPASGTLELSDGITITFANAEIPVPVKFRCHESSYYSILCGDNWNEGTFTGKTVHRALNDQDDLIIPDNVYVATDLNVFVKKVDVMSHITMLTKNSVNTAEGWESLRLDHPDQFVGPALRFNPNECGPNGIKDCSKYQRNSCHDLNPSAADSVNQQLKELEEQKKAAEQYLLDTQAELDDQNKLTEYSGTFTFLLAASIQDFATKVADQIPAMIHKSDEALGGLSTITGCVTTAGKIQCTYTVQLTKAFITTHLSGPSSSPLTAENPALNAMFDSNFAPLVSALFGKAATEAAVPLVRDGSLGSNTVSQVALTIKVPTVFITGAKLAPTAIGSLMARYQLGFALGVRTGVPWRNIDVTVLGDAGDDMTFMVLTFAVNSLSRRAVTSTQLFNLIMGTGDFKFDHDADPRTAEVSLGSATQVSSPIYRTLFFTSADLHKALALSNAASDTLVKNIIAHLITKSTLAARAVTALDFGGVFVSKTTVANEIRLDLVGVSGSKVGSLVSGDMAGFQYQTSVALAASPALNGVQAHAGMAAGILSAGQLAADVEQSLKDLEMASEQTNAYGTLNTQTVTLEYFDLNFDGLQAPFNLVKPLTIRDTKATVSVNENRWATALGSLSDYVSRFFSFGPGAITYEPLELQWDPRMANNDADYDAANFKLKLKITLSSSFTPAATGTIFRASVRKYLQEALTLLVARSEKSVAESGISTLSPSSAAASGGGGLPLAVVAGAAAGFLLILIIIVIIWRRRGRPGRTDPSAKADRTVVAFENPMYDDPAPVGNQVYEADAGADGLYDEPAFNDASKANPLYQSTDNIAEGTDGYLATSAEEETGGGYLDVAPDDGDE